MPSNSPSPRWMDSGTAVVRAPAEIDLVNAGKLSDGLISAIDAGARVVVADMATTGFCDSAGVKAIVRAYQHAKSRGSVLRLVTGQARVRRVFALTGVDRLVCVCTSLEEALGTLEDPAP